MVTIIKEVSVVGQSSVTITLDIPNGPDRHILVEALNASGLVLYSGETIVDLGGEPLQLTIAMSSLITCDLYVDTAGADESDCTDINNPCRTITFAVTQTNGNLTICVAAGIYDIEGGEDFPLNLVAGTNLRCNGTSHTTIINSAVIDGTSPDTIYGAAGASIIGCRIMSGDYSVAIDDNGEVITVNDCLIESTGYGYTGISLSADSTVSNSTISNFQGGEGGGDGIYVSGSNPVISGNTFENNYYGIYIASGSPEISGNIIGNSLFNSNAYGIQISDGTASVTGNTITYNSEGIRIYGGDSVINNNTLSCNSGVDLNSFSEIGTINARNNSWDNVPPSAILYPSYCNGVGEDICAPYGGSVDYEGASEAPACISIE